MRSKKGSLKGSKLYLILDTAVNPYEELFDIAQNAIHGGIDILQLRDKHGTAKGMFSFTQRLLRLTKRKIPLIVNDRLDVALSAQADGVHLGQDDLSITHVRKLAGNKFIIGASCQTSRHIQEAQRNGADYIGFGSIFKTLTKPQRKPMELQDLKDILNKSHVPIFCIGGISFENIKRLMALGVSRVAVCRDICLADNVKRQTQLFQQILKTGTEAEKYTLRA